jgi:hypothetical protein
MSRIFNDPKVETLLSDLYSKSKAQEAETSEYFRTRSGPWRGMEPRDHAHFADRVVALDREKCEFCYLLCRAIGARRIVEAGKFRLNAAPASLNRRSLMRCRRATAPVRHSYCRTSPTVRVSGCLFEGRENRSH